MVELLLRESEDGRYKAVIVVDEKESEFAWCDKLAAEELAFEFGEDGVQVRWEYIEDRITHQ